MDFTYLYDSTKPDFIDFTAGCIFTEEEVYAEIDSPENWTHREGVYQSVERTPGQEAEVADLLNACFRWGVIED
jgi:hypothetical protein